MKYMNLLMSFQINSSNHCLQITALCITFCLKCNSFIATSESNKERSPLTNSTRETLLHLRGDHDFLEERDEHAMELFLTEYPRLSFSKKEA